MKAYKITTKIGNNTKILPPDTEIELTLTEQEIRNLIKENPEFLTPTPTHKHKYFVPKFFETYYFITIYNICHSPYSENNTFDRYNKLTGNCFATEQDAQDELNRRQALVRIWNNYDDKYHWDIDWRKSTTKHGIAYDNTFNDFSDFYEGKNVKISTELPYFKSAEDRNQFVESNRDDLLTIFNIKK